MQPKGRRALSLRNPSNTRTGTESPISWTEFEVSAGHSDSTPVGSGGVLTQIPFTPELGAPPSFLLTFSNPVRNRQCLIQIKLGMAADIGREQNGFALAAAISVDLDQKVQRYASLLWVRRSQMISPPESAFACTSVCPIHDRTWRAKMRALLLSVALPLALTLSASAQQTDNSQRQAPGQQVPQQTVDQQLQQEHPTRGWAVS